MSAEDLFTFFEEQVRKQRGPPRGRDVQVGVTLDLLQAANGCRQTVSWRSPSGGVRSHEVNIPAGVDNGMNLRLNGKGEDGPAGPGVLYVQISVAEHPVFERDGADLHVRVRLSLAEAVLGTKVVIPTLEGDVSLKVPAGTQTGDRRVMTGRGIKVTGARQSGHQFVHFQVMIPRELSPKQKELIEAFQQ